MCHDGAWLGSIWYELALCVPAIQGFLQYRNTDVDLKKAAKMFANKFACGSSVAKNNQNQDEIVVQGDFSDDIRDLILATWPQVLYKERESH